MFNYTFLNVTLMAEKKLTTFLDFLSPQCKQLPVCMLGIRNTVKCIERDV